MADTDTEQSTRSRIIGALIVIGLYAVVQLAPRPAAIKPEGWRLLAIFVATIGGLAVAGRSLQAL